MSDISSGLWGLWDGIVVDEVGCVDGDGDGDDR
jgi:hypothetical protein